MWVYLYMCEHVCVCVCACEHVCEHVCVCLCLYIVHVSRCVKYLVSVLDSGGRHGRDLFP